MESRLIYEKDKLLFTKTNWIKQNNSESEWIYIEKGLGLILKILNEIFTEQKIFVSISRNESFETEKRILDINASIFKNSNTFRIWDQNFNKVLEYNNKLNLYRIGFISS